MRPRSEQSHDFKARCAIRGYWVTERDSSSRSHNASNLHIRSLHQTGTRSLRALLENSTAFPCTPPLGPCIVQSVYFGDRQLQVCLTSNFPFPRYSNLCTSLSPRKTNEVKVLKERHDRSRRKTYAGRGERKI